MDQLYRLSGAYFINIIRNPKFVHIILKAYFILVIQPISTNSLLQSGTGYFLVGFASPSSCPQVCTHNLVFSQGFNVIQESFGIIWIKEVTYCDVRCITVNYVHSYVPNIQSL